MPGPIELRQYRPDDVDAVCQAVLESKAELSPWMPWCHERFSREDAAAWVEGRPEAWARNEEWSFVVTDSSGRFLGACGIHRLDLRNGVGELGYWVRTSATRQGIATEAVRQACLWAFEEAGLHRVEILASVENSASRRVAEKAGAVFEGILKQRLRLSGRRHDAVLLAIVKGA